MNLLKTTISILTILLLTLTNLSCSSDDNTKTYVPPPKQTPSDPNEDTKTPNSEKEDTIIVTPKPDTKDQEFLNFGVIREITSNDNGALFGIKPSKGELEIISVNGPTFLGGYKTGLLTARSINSIFEKSSVPLSESEKRDLLKSYDGAYVIYFENYNGQLCTGEEFRISVSTLIEERKYQTTFIFSAWQMKNSSCQYSYFTSLTSNEN